MPNKPLDSSDYNIPTTHLAKTLIGCFLAVCRNNQPELVGRIVETEAYLFDGDPACHAHRGETKRNAAMFGEPGTAYVYLIYGMYYCFNVVTAPSGIGEAVLVRALEPVVGIEKMARRRFGRSTPKRTHQLCNGPGKLTIALGISARHNGTSLTKGPIKIYSRGAFPEFAPQLARPKIIETTRIGISSGADLPLRYYLADSPYVSKLAPSKPRTCKS